MTRNTNLFILTFNTTNNNQLTTTLNTLKYYSLTPIKKLFTAAHWSSILNGFNFAFFISGQMAAWDMCAWIGGRRWDWTFMKWNIFTTMNLLTCMHLMVSDVGRRGIHSWRTTNWNLSFVGYILPFLPLFLHVWIQRPSIRSMKWKQY